MIECQEIQIVTSGPGEAALAFRAMFEEEHRREGISSLVRFYVENPDLGGAALEDFQNIFLYRAQRSEEARGKAVQSLRDFYDRQEEVVFIGVTSSSL